MALPPIDCACLPLLLDLERKARLLQPCPHLTVRVCCPSPQAWREKHFRDWRSYDEEKLRPLAIAGFNSPPSQYQLHLQFMLPPFLPFQYYQYLMVCP